MWQNKKIIIKNIKNDLNHSKNTHEKIEINGGGK